MRVVLMKDTSPITITKDDLEEGPVTICRCGLSDNWPYCDNTHKQTRNETDGAVYSYRRDDDRKLVRSDGIPETAEQADPRGD